MPITSSCVSVMNCDVLGLSGSSTCGWTPATPSTLRIASMAAAGSRPPAVKPVPMPMPRPATEIWPSTNRSPPSMKRTMRSAMAPSATMPATPIAMPTMVKRYPRRTPRSALITRASGLPRSRSSQARLARWGPSPTTCCRSHDHHRLASAVERPAARTTITGSPRPSNGLRLALPFQPRLDGEAGAAANPTVDARDAIEDPQGDAHAPRRRHPVAARQHVEDGLVDAEAIARMHEQIEERRLVVFVNELEERV